LPKIKSVEITVKPEVVKETKTAVIDKEILRRYFGYSEFRQLQQDIILDVLKGTMYLCSCHRRWKVPVLPVPIPAF